MQQMQWQITNFTVGQHTEPGRVGAGSERFAREVAGLRVDANGHLRPRAAVHPFGETQRAAVTGVASAQDYLLSLRADGTLWIRFAAYPEAVREVQFQTPLAGRGGAEPMRGMLSLIGDFQDFAIVKAQGGSPFWIDMREDAESYLHAFKLGIDPPDWHVNTQNIRGSEGSQFETGTAYVFRYTYVRAFANSTDAFIENKFLYDTELLVGMESNPSLSSTAKVIAFLGPDDSAQNVRTFLDDAGGELPVSVLQEGTHTTVKFTDLVHIDDPQVTGIFIYQSEPIPALSQTLPDGSTVGDAHIDGLIYRRVHYAPRGRTEVILGARGSAENWPKQRKMLTDNDVLPETERIFLYNDRIFCPTEKGLRYSDVDGTVLKTWAYPKTNEISRSGIVDCLAHRGVLLFGGPTDFHSLTGTDAFTFSVQRLGTTGPVSAHAMNIFRESVAFAGVAGFYGTDGVSVQKLSDAVDADFEDYRVTSGHCHMLPDDSLLFSVQQSGETARRQVYHFDNGWFSWPHMAIRQVARWEAGGVRVLVADESQTLREVRWDTSVSDSDVVDAETDTLIEWKWESQRLNFGDERLKQFRELQIEGQALSLVSQPDARWELTRGNTTYRQAYAWRIGDTVFGVGGAIWGSASVASRVRLTLYVDDKRPIVEVFELRRDDVRPYRIPINRRGKAFRFKIEGRGHCHFRSLTLLAGK